MPLLHLSESVGEPALGDEAGDQVVLEQVHLGRGAGGGSTSSHSGEEVRPDTADLAGEGGGSGAPRAPGAATLLAVESRLWARLAGRRVREGNMLKEETRGDTS
jgi:hypothetical protein